MAPNDSGQAPEEITDLVAGRRKVVPYVVPVAVAGVAAATIGLVPALAASGDPDLPRITTQKLIEKIAKSDVQQLSGTVKISTDLGLPSLGGTLNNLVPQGERGSGGVSPEEKLMELTSGTHTLRVAADGPEKQRLSILDDTSEYSLIHNGDDVWAYDSVSNEVHHSEAPAETNEKKGDKGGKDQELPEDVPSTPQGFAEQALKAVDDTTSVTVSGTTRVAGRDAYQLRIAPKQSGSAIDSIRIAVDADTGVPLKFTLSPTGGGKAAIDAGFTQVDFSQPTASTFDFSPPKGAKVIEAGQSKAEEDLGRDKGWMSGAGLEGLEDFQKLNVIGEGWTTIAEIDAPGGQGLTTHEESELSSGSRNLLGAIGDKVSGKFGSGTVFSTRLVNALVTDDGKIYVGAVTKDALLDAANK
jgi:outer membrane lipoprotein-sorting protein